MFSLTGRTAVVTGAGSGIGRGIALALAEAGAWVLAADLDEASARSTCADIERSNGAADSLKVDVRHRPEIDHMVDHAVARRGRLDILVSAAGIGGPNASLLELEDEDWDNVIATNLRSLFQCARAAARKMAERTSGSIINITSQLSDVAQPNATAYVASKGGGKSLTKAMALDLAEHGIRVNAIAPGLTNTNMTRLDTQAGLEARRKIIAHIPMGRAAEPKDIAGAAVFLASDAASYVTGSTIYVDGGYLTI